MIDLDFDSEAQWLGLDLYLEAQLLCLDHCLKAQWFSSNLLEVECFFRSHHKGLIGEDIEIF